MSQHRGGHASRPSVSLRTVPISQHITNILPRRARIPTDLLLALILNKATLASAALLARHWLLVGHSEASHSDPHRAHHHQQSQSGNHSYDGHHPPPSSFSPSSLSPILSPSSHGLTSWAVATVVFLIAAIVQGLWFRAWTWQAAIRRVDPRLQHLPKRIAVLGVTLFAHLLVWLIALGHLPATNVIVFTQFCEVWAQDLAKSMRGRSHGGYAVLVGLAISFLGTIARGAPDLSPMGHPSSYLGRWGIDDDEDLPPSLLRARPAGLASPSKLRAASASAEANAAAFTVGGVVLGHVCLLVYAILTIEKERATIAASRESGGRRRANVLACILVAAVTLPLGLIGKIFGLPALPPLRTLSLSIFPSSSNTLLSSSSSAPSGHMGAYIVIAFGVLMLEPLVTSAIESHIALQARFNLAWPLAVLTSMAVGQVGFGVGTGWTEMVVALFVGWGLRTILKSSAEAADPVSDHKSDGVEAYGHARHISTDQSALGEFLSTIKSSFTTTQHYISVIMANPDSSKIFQFLVLNLAFMVVQLLWGVWTNSLGLISDAIHMFFDCAAIGMGLFASVMATWKTDRVFTYGYGRVETLSGFANGVFLILISLFIVFEAVQRIITPPVMHNTLQLLLVSSGGLAVNLFGMFAMGGHHHHGHSHSHSHGHDHHGHGHDHGHSHGHSHNMMGVYLHVMADTLGSVGVIISTLLIKYYGWTGFDPIASLFIAGLIVLSVIPLVVDAGRILCLDLGEEREQVVRSALSELHTIEGLASFAAPRFWPKDAETLVGTIIVRVNIATDNARRESNTSVGVSPRGSVSAQGATQQPHAHGHSHASHDHGHGHRHGHSHEASEPHSHAHVHADPNAPPPPELVALRVERHLKSRIEGLESVSVQVERAAPSGDGWSPGGLGAASGKVSWGR